MTKYIFVDFDGVLTSTAYQLRHEIGDLDPAKVRILSNLVEETHAYIVVTSAWRSTITEMRRVFRRAGFNNVLRWVVGITPKGTNRGYEITAWMFQHGVEQDDIVILDDEIDMEILLPRLVQTRGSVGLTVEDAQRVKALLEATAVSKEV